MSVSTIFRLSVWWWFVMTCCEHAPAQELLPNSQQFSALYQALADDHDFSLERVREAVEQQPLASLDEVVKIVRRQRSLHPADPYAGFDDPVLKHAVLYAIAYHAQNPILRGGIHDILTLEGEGKLPKGRQGCVIAGELAVKDSLTQNSTLVLLLKDRVFDQESRKLIVSGVDGRMAEDRSMTNSTIKFLSWMHGDEVDTAVKRAIVAVIEKHDLKMEQGVEMTRELLPNPPRPGLVSTPIALGIRPMSKISNVADVAATGIIPAKAHPSKRFDGSSGFSWLAFAVAFVSPLVLFIFWHGARSRKEGATDSIL